ncbi:NAD(P)-binding protein [Xylariaceae sp. FL1019]|nr:NAD(P)-binding protein [Xylariaceae sp. FL1019]
MSASKTAIITGGASGMGLAVAQSLKAKGGWDIHLFDLNPASGQAAADSLSATFHKVDVTNYDSLGAAFKAAYSKHERLDFVFANAGIAEPGSFYERHDEIGDGVPPPPKLHVVRILYDAVITTSHLAQHYFRLSPKDIDKNLVMTASCGALYPSYFSALYCGAKHGVLGFMRAIAKPLWHQEGIRVNAVCPGTVKTALLTRDEWTFVGDDLFTPVEKIAEVVMILVDGKDTMAAEMTRIDGEPQEEREGILWGEAIEVSGDNHYYRERSKYCDAKMAAVMKNTYITQLPGDESAREVNAVLDK